MTLRANEPDSSRQLGGAAADFVAALGRKVAELTTLLATLRAERKERSRDELRRKLHAIGAAARLFNLPALGSAIGAATQLLDEAPRGPMRDVEIDVLDAVVASLPERAWAREGDVLVELPTAPKLRSSPPGELSSSLAEPIVLVDVPEPIIPQPGPEVEFVSSRLRRIEQLARFSVMVVGAAETAQTIADILSADPDSFACETATSTSIETERELARALAPDVIVVDAHAPQAFERIDILVGDTLAGESPVVAITHDAESRSRLLALGVTKVVFVDPGIDQSKTFVIDDNNLLRAACRQVVEARERTAVPPSVASLEGVTLEQLANRFADEIRHALVESVAIRDRTKVMQLGAGIDVLAPIWGAMTRVRDVLDSKGFRFFGSAQARHEGSISLGRSEPSRPGEPSGPVAIQTQLAGEFTRSELALLDCNVLVADDDPGITRVLRELLERDGARVRTAVDGLEALHLARQIEPDIILSDVVMPRLDGVGLLRAIRRDPDLRDRGFLFLSWKEDLLARVRDLGAPARGVRKESDAEVILKKVRALVAPRRDLARRLTTLSSKQAIAEIRGRVADVSVSSLLQLGARHCQSFVLDVRGVSDRFTLRAEQGKIVDVQRVGFGPGNASAVGDFPRRKGLSSLTSLLGFGSGRFLLRGQGIGDPANLTGMRKQLAGPLRNLRIACDAVAEQDLALLRFDDAELVSYASVLTPRSRGVLDQLAIGASPRSMVVAGITAPEVLEDLLLDLAFRGCVLAAVGSRGEDLLARVGERHDLLDGRNDGESDMAVDSERPTAKPAIQSPAPDSTKPMGRVTPRPSSSATSQSRIGLTDPPPSSLADAVRRSVEQGAAAEETKPMLDTRDLRPRNTRTDRSSSIPRMPAVVEESEPMVDHMTFTMPPPEPKSEN